MQIYKMKLNDASVGNHGGRETGRATKAERKEGAQRI